MDNHDYYLAVKGMQGNTGEAQHYGLTVADFRFETTGGTMIDPAKPPMTERTYGDLVVTFEGQQGLSEFLKHLNDKTPVDAMTLYGQDHGSDVYRLTLAGARVTDVRTYINGGDSSYSVTLSPAATELERAPFDPAGQRTGANTTRWNFVTEAEGVDLKPATGLPQTATSVQALVDYYITIDGVAQGDSSWRKDGFALFDFSFEASREPLANGSVSNVAQFSSLRASLSPATYAALIEIMATRGSLSGVDIYGRALRGLHEGDVVYHAALDTVYVSGIAQAGDGFEASFAYKDLTVTTKQVDAAGTYVADDVFTGKGVNGSVGNHAVIGAAADVHGKFFLAIEGLDGDSTETGFEHMMEVSSFGFAHDAQVDFRAGVPAGKADFGEVELSFSTLENLTQFLVALNSDATMSKATLYGTKMIEGSPEAFYALTLADFKVAAVAQNFQESGQVHGYSVTLAPRSFEIAVAPQDPKTGKILAFDEYGYDTLSGQKVRLDPAVGRNDGIRGIATSGGISYLTIDGITGDSTTHKGAFEINGFAYDATSGGLAGTRPDFSVLTTAFASNSALAAVLRGLATGTHLTGVDIYTERTEPGSGKNGPVYHLELDDVFVTGLSEDGDKGFQAALGYRDMKLSTFDFDRRTGTISKTAGDVFVGKEVDADGGGVASPNLSGSFQGTYVLAVEGIQGTLAGRTGHNGLAVDGFAFTAENGQTVQGGTGAARPTNVGDVTIAISDQQGLTEFLSALQAGTTLSKATLYGQVDFGRDAIDAYALTLANFQVTSVQEDDETGYTVTLAPRQFEIASAPVNYDAKTVGTFSEFGYDVATGRTVNLTAATGVAPDARGPAGSPIRYYATIDWSSPIAARPPIVGDSVLHPGAFELDGFVLDAAGRSAAVPLSTLRASFATDGALTKLLEASTAGRSIDVDIYGVEQDGNGNERIVQHVALDYALPNSIVDTQQVGFGINFTYLYSTVTSYDVSSSGAVRIGDEFTTGNHTPRDMGARAVLTGAKEDSAFSIAPASLLQGFTDADGDTLSVSQVTASNGTVRFDGTRYVVTPTAGFTGTVTLSYLVADGHTTTPTTLSYDVVAVNHAPAQTGPAATLPAGTEDLTYNVSLADLLRGFTDADGDTLAVSVITADHGSVAANGAGGFTITPAADYNGPVSLRYTVGDGQGGSTSASIGFVLAAANDAPVAADDIGFATSAGAPIRILKSSLLANDHDVDGDALLLTGVFAGMNGTVTMDGGVIVFTPTAGYEGAASFGYTVSDGIATGAATVRLTVTSAAPVTTYAPATAGDDVIDHGGSQVRWLVNGGGGNDTLIGGLANDSLNGGAGDDTIRGGAGKDVLTGGPGHDQLWGDSGADTFVFNAGDIASGSLLDEIMDFEGAGNGYDGAGDIIAFAGFGTGVSLTLDAARTDSAADPTAHYYQVASSGFQGTIIVHYQGNAVLQAGDYWFY